MFSLSMIFFAFFLSTLVSKVKTATMVGMFFLVVGLLLMYQVFSKLSVAYIFWEAHTTPLWRNILMFFPPFNFGKIYLDISLLAGGYYNSARDAITPGPGFYWHDLFVKVPFAYLPRNGNYRAPIPAEALQFLGMDIVVFALLAWYLDYVIPNAYGNSKPFYFFVLPSFWGFGGRKASRSVDLETMVKMADTEQEDDDVHHERLRALDNQQSRLSAVRLLYLRKEYKAAFWTSKKKTNVAVDGSCWALNEGKLYATLDPSLPSPPILLNRSPDPFPILDWPCLGKTALARPLLSACSVASQSPPLARPLYLGAPSAPTWRRSGLSWASARNMTSCSPTLQPRSTCASTPELKTSHSA